MVNFSRVVVDITVLFGVVVVRVNDARAVVVEVFRVVVPLAVVATEVLLVVVVDFGEGVDVLLTVVVVTFLVVVVLVVVARRLVDGTLVVVKTVVVLVDA